MIPAIENIFLRALEKNATTIQTSPPQQEEQQTDSGMTFPVTLKVTLLSFVFGVTTIMLLLLFTYALARIMDYYCSTGMMIVSPDNVGGQNINGGRIARDTGLLGLTKQERILILERIFFNATKNYDSSDFNNRNNEDDDTDLEENNNSRTLEESHITCAICLNEYAQGEKIITGKSGNCHHMFHHACLLEWLGDQRKDICPCCRVEMFTCNEYKASAYNTLGEVRVRQAIMNYDPRYFIN